MDFMGFKIEDNIIWILAILAIVFFLFPNNNEKKVSKEVEEAEVEEKEDYEYIYRRKRDGKERRKLVY